MSVPCASCKRDVRGIRVDVDGRGLLCLPCSQEETAAKELRHRAHLYHVAKDETKDGSRESLYRAAVEYALLHLARLHGAA